MEELPNDLRMFFNQLSIEINLLSLLLSVTFKAQYVHVFNNLEVFPKHLIETQTKQVAEKFQLECFL